jgi:hypothetical protein
MHMVWYAVWLRAPAQWSHHASKQQQSAPAADVVFRRFFRGMWCVADVAGNWWLVGHAQTPTTPRMTGPLSQHSSEANSLFVH